MDSLTRVREKDFTFYIIVDKNGKNDCKKLLRKYKLHCRLIKDIKPKQKKGEPNVQKIAQALTCPDCISETGINAQA